MFVKKEWGAMCCACFCHGGLLSDIDGSIGGEETVIVRLGRLGLGWWGGWAGGEAGLVGKLGWWGV
ncbi:hypothetical protein [Bartonella sp. CL266QHHD]|uniref:hypothetical protein n=1 Tax=Bartonella sp. CL266QHHD TaxID=3243519 RepID=UPI0035D0125D